MECVCVIDLVVLRGVEFVRVWGWEWVGVNKFERLGIKIKFNMVVVVVL